VGYITNIDLRVLRRDLEEVFAHHNHQSMIPPFDIFKNENDGTVTWKGTAESLEVARLSVKVLMVTSAGSYIIHSHGTGNKIFVNADGSTERK
jgi:hypothetical protein